MTTVLFYNEHEIIVLKQISYTPRMEQSFLSHYSVTQKHIICSKQRICALYGGFCILANWTKFVNECPDR